MRLLPKMRRVQVSWKNSQKFHNSMEDMRLTGVAKVGLTHVNRKLERYGLDCAVGLLSSKLHGDPFDDIACDFALPSIIKSSCSRVGVPCKLLNIFESPDKRQLTNHPTRPWNPLLQLRFPGCWNWHFGASNTRSLRENSNARRHRNPA